MNRLSNTEVISSEVRSVGFSSMGKELEAENARISTLNF